MDEVHKGERPKSNVYNFWDKLFIRGGECNAPAQKKKKKKKEVRFLLRSHTCDPPTPYFLTTHSQISPSLFDWPSLLSTIFSFLFLFSHNTNTSLSHSLTLPLAPSLLITSIIFFQQDHRKNSIGKR